jgi:hypothetical protein
LSWKDATAEDKLGLADLVVTLVAGFKHIVNVVG